MASSEAAAVLTEQHRVQQQQVRALFLVEFLTLWSLLSSADPLGTGAGWVRAVAALVRRFRRQSSQVSVGYYRGFRAVEIPLAPPTRVDEPVLPRPRSTPPTISPGARPAVTPPRTSPDRDTPGAPPSAPRPSPPSSRPRVGQRQPPVRNADLVPLVLDDARPDPARDRGDEVPLVVTFDVDEARVERAVSRSLTWAGPANLESRRRRGEPEPVARDRALTQATAAAARHVLNGGRDTVLHLVEEDRRAIGWARVTDSDPCAFCALLASRGPVYRSETAAAFRAHDLCACHPEPVFSRGAGWPGRAREFRDLYNEATQRTSGADSIRAFRRAYEAQQRDQRRRTAAA